MIFENYQKNLFAVRLNLAKFSKIKPYFFRSFDDGTQSVPAQDDGVANCTSFRDLLFIKSLITHLFAPFSDQTQFALRWRIGRYLKRF